MKRKNKIALETKSPQGQSAVQIDIRPDSTMQMKFDFSRLPEPALYYYADCLAMRVDSDNQMVILTFGRSEGERTKFMDHVEVVMPTDRLLGDFWKSATDINAAVDQILQARRWSAFPRQMEPPPDATQTFYANVLFMVVGMGESSLDFYHLSPRQIHFAKTGLLKEIQVVPVLRVVISTALSKRFLLDVGRHSQEWQAPIRESNGVVHA